MNICKVNHKAEPTIFPTTAPTKSPCRRRHNTSAVLVTVAMMEMRARRSTRSTEDINTDSGGVTMLAARSSAAGRTHARASRSSPGGMVNRAPSSDALIKNK